MNQVQYYDVKPSTCFEQLIYYSDYIIIVIHTPAWSPNGRVSIIQVDIYRRNTTYCGERLERSLSVTFFLVRSLLFLPHCKKLQNSQCTSAIVSCCHLPSKKGNIATLFAIMFLKIFRQMVWWQDVGNCRFERKHTFKNHLSLLIYNCSLT